MKILHKTIGDEKSGMADLGNYIPEVVDGNGRKFDEVRYA